MPSNEEIAAQIELINKRLDRIEREQLIRKPFNSHNAVGLRFYTREKYKEAWSFAFDSGAYDNMSFPGKNTILINKDILFLFDTFKNSYIQEKVVSIGDLTPEERRKIRSRIVYHPA